MSEQNYLYTVTGLRDPFYAVVDQETGRAWTAPTKDGAIRQARDAGIVDFVEKTITRETFLRSLGIEVESRPKIHRDSTAHAHATEEAHPPAPAGAWFVPSEGVDVGADEGIGSHMPRNKPLKQWPATPPKPATPFAANAPIAMPGEEVIAPPDDVLILPSSQKVSKKKNPFTDKPPELPDDLLD